jgi:hypothetical protein
MIQYRVTYTVEEIFGNWQTYRILKADEPISRKEIARRLEIDIDSITDIKLL